MSHTPGPWRTCDDDCDCGVITSADCPVATVTSGEWGDEYPAMRQVGSSLENHYQAYIERVVYGNLHADTAKANARLISAAPDLLEALSALLLNIDAGGATLGAMKDARAAISKATGAA